MKMLHTLLFGLLMALVGPSVSHASFIDVDVTHPYFLAIHAFENDGIIEGYDTGVYREFRAENTITRAAALKILTLTADINIETPSSKETYFSDVNPTAWYGPYVHTAVDREIVRGYEDGTFRPAAEVTRAEFLKMLTVAMRSPIDHDPSPDEEWFTPYIEFGTKWNLLPETNEPHDALSRGELAEITYRLGLVKKNDYGKSYRYSGSGKASYYHPSLAGNSTAFGEPYDPQALTVAHRTLPNNTRLKLSHEGKSVIVRVNDRGPYHEDRVIDLSERTFETLAPLSRGVITIDFEVIPATDDTASVTVPDVINEALELETTTNEVPDLIAQELQVNDSTPPKTTTIAEFEEYAATSISFVAETYYDDLELRSPFPTTIQAGTILQLQGRATEYGNETVRAFITREGANQQQFYGELSGKNFTIDILFENTGTHQLGIVFDQGIRSNVASIEVIAPDEKLYKPSGNTYSSALEVFTDPANEVATFSWTPQDVNVITKIELTQGANTKYVFVGQDLGSAKVPYSYFHEFDGEIPLNMSLHHAESTDGSLWTRNTNWLRADQKDFTLAAAYENKTSDDVTFTTAPRYANTTETVRLVATKTSARELNPNAFLIRPQGTVDVLNYTEENGSLYMNLELPDAGIYIIQISATNGETVASAAIYARENDALWALPVLPWNYVSVPAGNNVNAVQEWVNAFRAKHRRAPLTSDINLTNVAQPYSELMAAQDFISHTAPNGKTFSDRVNEASLNRDMGENLAWGTNLEVALESLELSPSHRKNLLETKWNRIGLGLAFNSANEAYVTMIFSD